MVQPMLICGIVLACVLISVDAQTSASVTTPKLLSCRVCKSATSLDDCKETQTCSSNEECYTDELITPSLQIIFNAGCRSIVTCRKPPPRPGKRAVETLLACSRCCNQHATSNSSSTECNANLCGLKKQNTLSNQCYHCGDDEDSKQGAVYDPMLCRKIKSCADDEVCRVTTLNTAGVFTYESGCNQKLQCQILTIATLQSENIDTGVDVASILASAGKRDNPTRKRQQSICDICCGDGLCNDSDCESVKIRIMQFANATRFNYTTLKLIR